MNKDHVFAGLTLVFVIVLMGSIGIFHNINKRLTADLATVKAERAKLNKHLEVMRVNAADADHKLAERLEEVKQLHGHIREISKCVDGAFEVLKTSTASETSEAPGNYPQISRALGAVNPEDPRLNALLLTLVPCQKAYDIIQELNIPRLNSATAPSLDSKAAGSR